MKSFCSILSLSGCIAAVLIAGCSTQKKLTNLRNSDISAQLSLGRDTAYVPLIRRSQVTRDTLKIKDEEGQEIIFMKAVRNDETGEMVANEVLDAAVVTARFRNIAERHGKVDLAFQVIVPGSMQDSKWQLRFYPDMYILGDSIRLDPVMITGTAYRKAQLKGYQQYNRFLSRIVSDSTRFVDLRQLEIFLRRNIPQLYAFKSDTTEVSDEAFYSIYGVSERQAVEHYTNKIAKSLNERRKSRIDKMYRKYVKVPIVSEGIRLDTILAGENGDFIYNYIQTINTRPRLRRVDIVLSGEIYEEDKNLYNVPRSEPLTFYISSLSAFTDNTERYLTKVIERQAEANSACYVEFLSGKSDIDIGLGRNREELGQIQRNIAGLLQNTVFDLDSIVVAAYASPEGKVAANRQLSKRRGEAIGKYLNSYIKEFQDSLERERGFSVDESGRIHTMQRVQIPFISRYSGENWDMLDRLVDRDTVLTDGDKSSYDLLARIEDLDAREYMLSREPYYSYVRQTLYPRLRVVQFNFYLHRKDMVKDTVHTTVLDSVYMKGVQALKNMDYVAALAILQPYNDFNAAVAYTALDRNLSALEILDRLEKTPEVNYMLALIYSRMNNEAKAVEHYVRSCQQDHSFVYRGNLDPEISALIQLYGLNQENDEEDVDDYL